MISKNFVLQNRVGLHARPAAKLVEAAGKFGSEVTIINGQKIANAKSILGVLALGAEMGTEVEIDIEGEDEAAAMAEIEKLINNNFGEK